MDKVQEIMSRWNALQPLSERDQEMLSRRFTIDFNYNSNLSQHQGFSLCGLAHQQRDYSYYYEQEE